MRATSSPTLGSLALRRLRGSNPRRPATQTDRSYDDFESDRHRDTMVDLASPTARER